MQKIDGVEYSQDDLYTISKNSTVLQNLVKKKTTLLEQKYEFEIEKMKEQHELKIKELKAKYKAKYKKKAKKQRKHGDDSSESENYISDSQNDVKRLESENEKLLKENTKLELEKQQLQESFKKTKKDLKQEKKDLEGQLEEAKNDINRLEQQNLATKAKYKRKIKDLEEAKFFKDQDDGQKNSYSGRNTYTAPDDQNEGLPEIHKKGKSRKQKDKSASRYD